MKDRRGGNDDYVVSTMKKREAPRSYGMVVPTTGRRAVPVCTGSKYSTRTPEIGINSYPTLHSSTNPRRDRVGRLDPMGSNDEVERAMTNALKDEEILQTLDTEPERRALHE